MKGNRQHRVPLSDAAIDLLESLPRLNETKLLFPSNRGRALSDMTLTKLLRRMNIDATVHGFRSTFRDWAAERTSYPEIVPEMALAHTIESKVERAYRRSDLFHYRRDLMHEWGDFVYSN